MVFAMSTRLRTRIRGVQAAARRPSDGTRPQILLLRKQVPLGPMEAEIHLFYGRGLSSSKTTRPPSPLVANAGGLLAIVVSQLVLL